MAVQLKFAQRNRNRIFAAFLAVIAAAAIAGCGGDSEEDVTRDAFIAEADAICAQYTANSDSLEAQFDAALQSSDLEGAARYFEDQAAEVTAMLDELEELTPPVADQTTMDQIIALGRQRVDVAEEAASAIAGGDKEAMITAGKEASLLAGQYFQLTDSFGFEACGSGGSGVSDASGATGTTGTTS
ncbi:MAG: hypothetical protein QG596_1500 [Actinomycetota bacterium]|jgi:hypothetical protein|nr:hypothetical protein [Actinomycetota bacterium]